MTDESESMKATLAYFATMLAIRDAMFPICSEGTATSIYQMRSQGMVNDLLARAMERKG